MRPPHASDKGPLLGSVPDLVRDFVQTFVRGWHEVGDVCLFRGPRPMCLVAHPDDVRHVMVDRQPIYPRSEPILRWLRPIMGEGLFTAAGPLHARQRRLLDPLLSATAVAPYEGAIQRATERSRNRLADADGTATDVQEEMFRLTMDLICDVWFGDGPGPDPAHLAADLSAAVDYAVPRILLPVSPPAALQPAYHRARRALERLDRAVSDAISVRQARLAAGGDRTGDLLTAVLSAGGDERMTERQARDEVMTSLFGAFKGIAVALTWVWHLLGTHPEAAARVVDEARGAGDGGAPGLHHLPQLDYTRMVVEETLRLHPPLWLWSRPPTEDDVIGGYDIPAGLFVLCIPLITHRHPEFWPDPDVFEPERFAPERAAERHPFAYFPFGGGPRRCIGEDLSMLSLVLVVAGLAQHHRFEPLPGRSVRVGMDFMLRHEGGLPMVVRAG